MKGATADLTPEELRTPLLEKALVHVSFDSWTDTCLMQAAEDMGIAASVAELAYPGGAKEMMEEYLAFSDTRLAKALSDKDMPSLKIRDRITVAIRTKLELQASEREVVRRTLSTLALPQNLAMGPKALWKTADTMWRAAGDTSTDHNWYTKRMTLSAVLSSVLLFWLNDDSEGFEETWAFLDRRIADVMKIESAKWQLRNLCKDMPSASRFLGRLRYPGL